MVLLQDAEKLKRERARTLGAMEEIQELLGMSGLHRVESYDISNINGFETCLLYTSLYSPVLRRRSL